jgi:hypothetical protein
LELDAEVATTLSQKKRCKKGGSKSHPIYVIKRLKAPAPGGLLGSFAADRMICRARDHRFRRGIIDAPAWQHCAWSEQASFQGFILTVATKLVFAGSSWNPIFHYKRVVGMFRVRDTGTKSEGVTLTEAQRGL